MTMPRGLQDLIAESETRRTRDAGRFGALDWDACQLCESRGPDRRSLIVNCGYAVHEVIPEAIDVHSVPDMEGRGYFLRICKSCRGALLGHLQAWRDERVARRGLPMDEDGDDDGTHDPERCIPVREHGATVWLTREEWDARQVATGGTP